MPFVSNMPEEEKEDQPTGSQGTVSPVGGGGAVRLSPSGGVGATGGAGSSGAPSSAGNPPSPAGGQFASLNQYLNANQGQAQPLAQKVTSGITNQYNNLSAENASTLGDINSQIAANGAPSNTNDVLAQEAANPVSFASNPGNVTSFQSLLNGVYNGPTSAESTPTYQNQQNAINSAISAGQNSVSTEAGREGLLTQNEATPTTGVTALNSAILSQDPNALNSIETAYQPFSGLLTNLQTGAASADQQIAQNQTNLAAANQEANAAINNQVTGLNTNVNNEYQALQNQYNRANTAASTLASSLQGGKLPSGYGVDPGLQAFITSQINPWLATNAPGQTATYNFANAVPQFTTPSAPTLTQAATAQDYADAQAFQNLMANTTAGIATPIINSNTASQAGTYTTPTLPTVNNNTLAADIAAGLGSTVSGNVAAGPYNQYLALLAALQKYQGLPVGANAPNPGTQIPTIS